MSDEGKFNFSHSTFLTTKAMKLILKVIAENQFITRYNFLLCDIKLLSAIAFSDNSMGH